jgi:hypothetical protein
VTGAGAVRDLWAKNDHRYEKAGVERSGMERGTEERVYTGHYLLSTGLGKDIPMVSHPRGPPLPQIGPEIVLSHSGRCHKGRRVGAMSQPKGAERFGNNPMKRLSSEPASACSLSSVPGFSGNSYELILKLGLVVAVRTTRRILLYGVRPTLKRSPNRRPASPVPANSTEGS